MSDKGQAAEGTGSQMDVGLRPAGEGVLAATSSIWYGLANDGPELLLIFDLILDHPVFRFLLE